MRQTPYAIRTLSNAIPTLLAPDQQEWEHLWEVDAIPPKSTASSEVYTVPEGYRLLFKGGFAFCELGNVQKVMITKTPGVLGAFYFSRLGAFSFAPSSEVPAGHTITYYMVNNSTKSCYGGISLIGILEKVE